MIGMPANTNPGMAFVLVQHLDPTHASILVELIARTTQMPVSEAVDGVVVKVNCVYIIPPNHDMAILNGALQLLAPTVPRGQRQPIDYFFRALAADQRENAIAIVLSGTGSDGSLGVRAIKAEGGMGIGLVLIRRLAELHGGGITVQSELGHGSTFTLRLPVGETA